MVDVARAMRIARALEPPTVVAQTGETLLIRGGTTSVGLTAAILARHAGLRVLATTRREDRREMLLANGADEVFVDDGHLANAVKAAHPRSADNTSTRRQTRCRREG